jgi:murein DD-endopeptidase MepM/ murein hydrolase activator NlpD
MSQELGGYLAALRELNGGNYNSRSQDNGVTPFGAYGMLLENWNEWSSIAGYGGADPADPSAQDAVAGFWAANLFRRYGSWEMVSGAWYAGQDQADQVMREGRDLFRNQRIRAYQEAVTASQQRNTGAPVPVSARRWVSTVGGGGWIHPIAGQSEYGGSFMPNTTNHRGRTHPAIDVYAAKGTPIVSPVSGKVMRVGKGDKGGNFVTVLGKDGITYYFAHMDQASTVKQGQAVGAGAHLGFVGNTGSASSTSPHLHISMKQGGAVINPKSYLQGSRNAEGYFEAKNANHQMGQQQAIPKTLDQMLGTISDGMVPEGTERQDPRLIGVTESTEVTQPSQGGPR